MPHNLPEFSESKGISKSHNQKYVLGEGTKCRALKSSQPVEFLS